LKPSDFIAIPRRYPDVAESGFFEDRAQMRIEERGDFRVFMIADWQSTLLWSFSTSPDSSGHDNLHAGSGRKPISEPLGEALLLFSAR
jgi:hypothetical protein